MEISGSVKVVNYNCGNEKYEKSELVVSTDEQYSQSILIEFGGTKSNMLDSINVGDKVKVSINIGGREWTNPQGEVRYFNSIKGWKIEKLQSEPTLGVPIGNDKEQTVYPVSTDKEDNDLPF